MQKLLEQIRKCKVCEPHLQLGAKPILAAHPKSKIIIIGQAPGKLAHESGIPWNDKSGDTLREWMGIEKNIFYDAQKIGIMPMGFCFPGKGKSGDLPPRKECAPLWHEDLLKMMSEQKLILLIGQYAQNYYLKKKKKGNLTETIRNYHSYLPEYFPLPHPSPRNNIWMAKNPWFREMVLPELRKRVGEILVL